MNKKYGDKVAFIGVAWAGNTGSYTQFIARHGITFPTIDDTPGDLFSTFKVSGQPAFAFVKGEAVEKSSGSLSETEIESRIESMING